MSTTTTTDFGATLNAAVQGGYIAQLSGGTYTITQPIVIYVNSTTQGVGIDGGGATLISQVPAGQPVIQFVIGPNVDLRYLDLSNFTIQGNGSEGDGIKIVADGNDRWVYNWSINNVTVDHVGGYGLDMQGSVFEGLVSNSWMNNNGLGGALFEHSANAGQVSALRWFGGGADNNNGPGIMLANGARDLSVDGATFTGNHGDGINALNGITSVSNSSFTDNTGSGVNFWVYGNFNNDSFTSTSAGLQKVGISGYLAGDATLIGDSSHGSGTLANLGGTGYVLETGNSGTIVNGSGVNAQGLGDDNHASVTISNTGVSVPSLIAVTSGLTANLAASTGTGALETALKAAFAGSGVAHLGPASYTVTSPIIIHLAAGTNSGVGSGVGIDLGGAKISSQISGGGPVIEIIVDPGVNVSNITLSNFSLQGNGGEGDGIKIVADGADRSISNLQMTNVNIEHVGGVGLDVLGNIHGVTVNDSWMNGDNQGGARFANSAGGGTVNGVQWLGGGFRHNGIAGLIADNGAHDVTVKGAYFVENNGPGVNASAGLTLVQASGFENNTGAGAVVGGSGGNFTDDTFSTYGVQTVGVSGNLSHGTVSLTGSGAEYYGAGSDPTSLANIQGSGTVNVAGGGKIVTGSSITMAGANPLVGSFSYDGTVGTGSGSPGTGTGTMPTVTEALASDTGAVSTDGITSNADVTGTADPNAVVHFTIDGSAIAATATANASGAWSYTPTELTDGSHTIVASETNAAGSTGTASLTFNLDTKAPTPVITGGTLASGMAAVTGTTGEANDTVLLYDGNTWLASATTGSNGAFSFTVPAAGNVVHTYGTSATDLAGNVGHSNFLTLGENVPPPTVTESLGSDTGSSSSDRITSNAALTGTGDPNAVVHFTVDGGTIAASATANASGIWAYTPTGLADGSHTIVASAANAGGTGTATLNFTLDRSAPSVSSIAASGSGITNGSGVLAAGNTVTLTVNMSEAVTVTGSPTLTLNDGGTATYTGGSGSAALTFTHTVASGQNTSDLAISSFNLNGGAVSDLAGNAATLTGATNYNPTGTLQINTTVVTPPPTVTESLASDTGSSSTDRITSSPALTGTGEPNAVVHFTIDGSAIAVTATANANGAWSYAPTGLADGSHTIVASEANAGGTGTASLAFTLDTKAPNPVLTGGTLTNGMATVTGTAGEANDVVLLYDGNTWLASATTGTNGAFSFTVPAAFNVVHNYGTNATDLAGNVGHSNSLTLGGTTPPPIVTEGLASDTGSSSTDRITSSPVLTGTGDPNAVVHFTIDGSAIAATATANASGAWSYTPTGLADGSHTVVASETNAGGSAGTASLAFTLDTQAPTPTITGGTAANGQATVTGTTGEANDIVMLYEGNTWLASAMTGANGAFSFTVAAASGTDHTYDTNVTDPAGNTGQSNSSFILGTNSADTLVGTSARDVLIGGGGNDKLTGGGGADRLTGGSGADTFIYTAAANSTSATPDTITDFTHGSDKIDLTGITGITATNGIPKFQGNITGTGNLTLNTHSVAYIEVGGNTQILVNTSGAAETVTSTDTHAADMNITLTGVNLGLTSSDFHHN
jgi:class 3 adenylate cyclase